MMDILYVDDDRSQRDLGRRVLEMDTDYEVDTAPNFEDLNPDEYRLVISDYTIHGGNTETLEEIDSELIIYTGHERSKLDIPEDATYLQKGVDIRRLVETAEEILEE